MGRPLLGALVAEEHVALVEAHRPGELLRVELLALEPELLVQIGGRGGEGRLRRVRGRRREKGVPGGGGGVGGIGHEEEGEEAVLQQSPTAWGVLGREERLKWKLLGEFGGNGELLGFYGWGCSCGRGKGRPH